MQIIKDIIVQFSPATTNEELDKILEQFRIVKIELNKYLLKEGKTCKQLSIVKSGCFKVIYGMDRITWFAFEGMPITEMQSFISQKVSKFSIQAIEDSEVFSIDYEKLQSLYQEIENFKFFGLKMTERILIKTINRATSLQFDSAESRYEQLFQDPNYLNRIPLQDLASFLGITANSLSRIRKRTVKP